MRNAGNLLGITLNVHPGVLGWDLSSRIANISGGVAASLPGQNGHSAGDIFFSSGSHLKSFGRLARSVDMITQRPRTGSLRSSGISLSFLLPVQRTVWE